MSEELKPCPFCGSEIKVRIGDADWEGFIALICQGQKTIFCRSQWFEGTKDEIVEAWNTRKGSEA